MELGTLVGYLQLNGDDFDKGLGKAESGFSAFAKRTALKAAAAGAAIAGAVVAAVVGGMNIEAGTDKVAAQLNLSGPDAERAGKLAGELYAGAYVGSLEEGGQLVRSIAQNIGTDLNDVDFSEIAAKVADLGNGFDQDIGATTKAVGQLMKTGLAADATEALDIVTAGFQSGADASGDFLDTLNEYGTQFRKVGLDGAAATGLISQGLQAGARDGDLVADAIKEFSIRAIDGSKTTVAGFEDVGLNAQRMAERIGEGGDSATVALDATLDGLRRMDDPVARSAAAVALFGTQAEDLGDALYALDPSEAAAGLGELEGRAASFGTTLNDNAVTSLQSFKNQAQLAFFGLANNAIPVITSVASSLADNFGPAIEGVKDFIADDLIPALQDMGKWIEDNKTPIGIIVGLITAVFIPHLVALATSSTINAAKVAASWVVQSAAAIGAGAVHSAQIVWMIARWAVLAAAAVVQSAIVATAWATGIVASAVAGAASFAVQVARVVGGWVVMAAQSLIQAARMAAAWIIALGPIGWVTAAVIGLVALIIANWDTVVAWTRKAWTWVTDKIGQAWDWIKDKVTGAASAVWNAVQSAWNTVVDKTTGAWNSVRDAVSNGVSSVVDFVRGLPGKILNGLGNMGSLLYSAGSDLLLGMVNGIKNVAGRVASAVKDAAKAAVDGVKSFLGIHSPSTVFTEIGQNVGQGWINGVASVRPAMVDEVGQAAQAILERWKSGGQLFEDFSWKGNPDLVRTHNDAIANAWAATGGHSESGKDLGAFLRDFIGQHTTKPTSYFPAATYSPAYDIPTPRVPTAPAQPAAPQAPPSTLSGGPLVHIENWHEEPTSPDRIARDLSVMMRVGGFGA